MNTSAVTAIQILVSALGLVVAGAHAQTFDDSTAAKATLGSTPAGLYSISQMESIDTVTGNLFLRIPLTTLPLGRAAMTEGINLVYNSQIYDQGLSWQDSSSMKPHTNPIETHTLELGNGGWRYEWMYNYGIGIEQLPVNPTVTDQCAFPIYGYTWKTVLYFPDGSRHPLHLMGYSDTDRTGASHNGYYQVATPWQASTGPTCYDQNSQLVNAPTGPLTFYTTDGTFIAVTVTYSGTSQMSWVITFPDGRLASGYNNNATDMVDTNGNYVLQNSWYNPQTSTMNIQISDPVGRTVTLTHQLTSAPPYSDSITRSGTALSWQVNWKTVSGNPILSYQTDSLGDTTTLGYNVSQKVVDSVQFLTETLNYQFGYDTNSWGELNSVILPSFATVSYTYAGDTAGGGYGYPWPPNLSPLAARNPLSSKTVTWQDLESTGSPQRTEASSFTFNSTYSTMTNPDGGTTKYTFFDLNTPAWSNGLVYHIQQPDGSILDRTWQQNTPFGCSGRDPCNPYVQYDFRSAASSGAPSLTAATVHSYDRNGNQTSTSEYDWVPYSTAYIQSFTPASGTPVRTTTNSFARRQTSAGGQTTDDANGYWHPSILPSNTALNLLTRSVVSGFGATAGPGSISEYDYNGGPNSNRLSQERHWDSTLGISSQPLNYPTTNAITVSYVYDSHGTLTSLTNARGYTVTFTYDSNGLCLTQRKLASATPNQRTFNYGVCNFSTNLPSSEVDADHNITHAFTYDYFDRVILRGDTGGAVARQKTSTYADYQLFVEDRSDLNSNTDAAITHYTYYDPLWRVRRTTDAQGNSVHVLHYTPQSSGYSYQLVSSPTATETETTMGWTRSVLDTSGRVIEIQHFDGAAMPYPWGSNTASTGTSTISYASNVTTTTDEAGVVQSTTINGLGQLIQVYEPALSATTTYAYDALNNLATVTPASGNVRTFSYSSLSRLVYASNPENGYVSYAYDPNGNLHSRTSGGITTTYAYDELDELTGKTYSDSTPSTSYSYNKGWRISASSGNTIYAYTQVDGLGRVTAASQTTAGQTYPFSYGYNLIDEITTMTMPTGRVITTSYDNLGHPTSLTGKLGSFTTPYAVSVSYAPHGAIQQMLLSNNEFMEQNCYNSLLQPTAIRQRRGSAASCAPTSLAPDSNDIGYVQYSYYVGQNNGSIAGQTMQYGGGGSFPTIAFHQSYTYVDPTSHLPVNRLTNVSESGPTGSWSQNFGYDQVGNRWLYGGSLQPDPLTPTGNVYDGNNHMSTATYGDGRGNVTKIGPNTYAYGYDAENRLISSTFTNVTTYTYDADGRRVTKQTIGLSGETTQYVYDVTGELAEEITVAVSGTLSPCTTCYYMADHLGSTRMITDSTGNQQVLSDYAPFGEALSSLTTSDGRDSRWGSFGPGIHFTGQEQEGAETDYMHYFGARYYSGGQGRWSSPDPDNYDARLELPETWNMYQYGWNNPLKYKDDDGRVVNLALAAGGAAIGGVLGFGGSAISQYVQTGSVDWGAAAAYGAGGAVSGAAAGFTFGGSLVAQAVASVGVATVANIAGGATTRALTGDDVLDTDAITSDVENGLIGGSIGAGVQYLGTVVNLPVKPSISTPLASVRTSLKRMARLRAWEQQRNQLSSNFSSVGSTMGTVYTNFVVQVKSTWDNIHNYLSHLWLEMASRPQQQNGTTSSICYVGQPGCSNPQPQN